MGPGCSGRHAAAPLAPAVAAIVPRGTVGWCLGTNLGLITRFGTALVPTRF